MSLANHIEEQARQVDRNPTEPQKKAGNYAKGHVKIHGLDVSIENPRGSWRTGGPEGKKWKARLPHHYGYIRKTEGADGDHVDIYIGPHLKAPHAFIIDQHNLHGGKSFDEHKVMLAFGSKQQAIEAYHRAFSDGRGKDRIGHVETMTIDGFKHWLANGDTTRPVKHHDRERLASGGAVNGHRPSDLSDRERAEKALPPNHKLGMRVPQGGSMCANCRFLTSPTTCGNAGFVKWNGGPKLPAPANQYCCDNYQIGRRKRADGGSVDDLSDSDRAAMMPETYVNPLAKGLVGAAGRMAGSVASLPQRAIEASAQDVQHLGEQGYEPQLTGPALEAAMLPMGTGAIAGVPVRAGEAVVGAGPIRAYHGSPHDFDAFDLSKIGTGEGNQAYGHGLYFAENPDTAEAYRNALMGQAVDFSNPEHVAAAYSQGMSSKEAAIEALRDNARTWENGHSSSPEVLNKAADLLESGATPKKPGRMYEVDINADPEHFLDWDKPLNEQSPEVMAKVAKASGMPQEQFHDLLFARPTKPEDTARLAQAGIPGIKYLDQGSRFIPQQIEHLKTQVAGLEDMLAKSPDRKDIADALAGRREELAKAQSGETHNYVVFNDKLIDILRKYGIAAAAAPTVAQEIMSQGKQHFATGGRVHMADGGVPAFDETRGADASGPPAFDETRGPDQDVGSMTALGRGAAQGATFGFADELAGLYGAGPQIPSLVKANPLIGPATNVAQPVIGAARMAKEYLMGGDQTATTAYGKARDEARAADELAKQQHPYLHAAGELAGSIPAMAVLPGGEIAEGANLATKMVKGAQVGAEYGGLSGLGEGKDIGDSAMKSAEGIVGGIVGGAGAPVVGAGLSKIAEKFVSPAVGAIRGAINPEAEASRRLAAALQKDQDLIAAGKAEGMSPTEWINARHAGEPVTLADLGSSNTQALLRSSANTSPEGRAILEKALNDRFYGQSERVANEVRGLVAGGANAGKTAEDLVSAYDKGRKPLYKQAYADGDKQIMSPAIEQMMGSPSFTKAMKGAVSSGQDRAVTEGYGAFNPGVTIDPGGAIRFNKGPTGVPIFPNLQYWDAVKRQLDDMAGAAMRSGEKGQGGVLSNMANTLRSELDKQVTSYADARGFASKFFGESNALEAGRNLAGKKVDPSVISDAMKKMKPDERALFQEGYASDWANRVISNISDTRDITNAMFNSPNERARALAVFGQAGLDKIQARMTLETIMDGARKAMGNSTTARQLIEAGLAGGTLEGYLSGWDPTRMAEGAAGAAGARKFLGSEMAAGARHLVGKVDSKTARLVAELLTSNDPTKLSQGMRMAQKNQRIAAGLKNIANRIALAGQQQAAPPAVRGLVAPLQGPMPVSADQKQQ